MNERERFLQYMHFKPVDRIPLMEMGLWPETLERWHHEGLPKWVTSIRHLEDYLRLDRSFNVNWLPINGDIYPPFQEKVLEETDEEQVISDANGVIYRQRKTHKTIPNYIRFPIQNEADYMDLLPRLDGADPGRYSDDFDRDLRWRRERGEIIGVNFRGFFCGFLRPAPAGTTDHQRQAAIRQKPAKTRVVDGLSGFRSGLGRYGLQDGTHDLSGVCS